jgi:dsRNA-specific ribonuclease
MIKVYDDNEGERERMQGYESRKKKKEKCAAHQAVKSIMVFLTLNDSPIFSM